MIKRGSLLAVLLFSSVANAGFYSGNALLSETGGYVKNKNGAATVAEALDGGSARWRNVHGLCGRRL